MRFCPFSAISPQILPVVSLSNHQRYTGTHPNSGFSREPLCIEVELIDIAQECRELFEECILRKPRQMVVDDRIDLLIVCADERQGGDLQVWLTVNVIIRIEAKSIRILGPVLVGSDQLNQPRIRGNIEKLLDTREPKGSPLRIRIYEMV